MTKWIMGVMVVAALFASACTPTVEIEVTPQPTTTTEAPVTTTVPAPTTTTTTEAPVDDAEFNEEAYLYTIDELLSQEYGGDGFLLEMGYEFCDLMAQARSEGMSVGDYQELIMDNFDDDTWLDALFMSGAAAGSLCDEHYNWVMDLEGMDA